MTIANNKKCQTLTNVIAEELIKLKEIANRLKIFRQAFTDQKIEVISCGLKGNITALSTWITAIDASADNVIVNKVAAHAVPGHGTNSLGDI